MPTNVPGSRYPPAAALALLIASVAPLPAQVVAGRVLDASTGAAIAAAEIALLDEAGEVARTVVADREGRFRLTAPGAGEYRIRGRRIGFAETVTPAVELARGTALEVEVRLSVEALPVEPLTVTGLRRNFDARLERRGFYERKDLYETRMGFATFLEAPELDRTVAFRPSDFFRHVRRFRVVSDGGRKVRITAVDDPRCSPAFYIDGHRFRMLDGETIDDVIAASEIMAIEIYSHSVHPAEFPSHGCGSVAIWTGLRPR